MTKTEAEGAGSSDSDQIQQLGRRAVRGAAVFMVVRLGMQVFQWGVTLFVARLLVPGDYGLMTAGMVFVNLADMLSEAGVGKAVVHKKDLSSVDIAQGFTLCSAFSVLLYAILFAIAPFASYYIERPEFSCFLRTLALLILITPFRSIPMALLDRDLHMTRQSFVVLVGAVLQGILVLILAWLGFGYWSLAAGTILSRTLEACVLAWTTRWRPCLARPGREARELLAYGIHVSLGTVLWFIYSNADFAVVMSLFGTVALGFYSFAFQIISMPVQKFTANINQVAFPLFCKMRDEPERIQAWFLRMAVLIGFLSLPALIGLALVASDAIPLLLGAHWTDAVKPFQILSPAGVVMVFAGMWPPLLNARGRPDVNLRFTAACTVVVPMGFLAGGLFLGLNGVCLAWLTLYPALVFGLIHLTTPITGVSLARLLGTLLPLAYPLAFMSICVLGVQHVLSETLPAVRLSLAIGAGVVSYAGWILLFSRQTILKEVGGLWRELRGRRSN